MPILDFFRRKTDGDRWWKNCCKAPPSLQINPPLPPDYSAWIHRCGWILYVHEPTRQSSWMHPGKLAEFEAKGMKGPGLYGPEMWIFEKNVNRGGHYCVDYGYPPMGRIRSAQAPMAWDYDVMDRIGYDAWRKQTEEKAAAAIEVANKMHNKKVNSEEDEEDGGDVIDGIDGIEENNNGNAATESSENWDDPEWQRKYREVRQRVMKEQGVWTLDQIEMNTVSTTSLSS